MKILQVIHGFLPQFRGGTELYVLKLARELRDQGHDVEIVTGTTDTAERGNFETYEYDGFKVWKILLDHVYAEHWTRSFSPVASDLFREVLRRAEPDIVHVQHWYRLSRNLVETCYRAGVPSVCTLHDMWTSCPRVFRIREETFCDRPLGRESCIDCVPRFPWMDDTVTADQIELFKLDFMNEMALAHRIIVPTSVHGETIRRANHLGEDRFVVLPHGTIADVSRSWPVDAGDSGGNGEQSKGKIRCGVWSHLSHMKGPHLVLEALRKLRSRGRFEVHIWGKVIEPHYRERLEEAARGLDVVWHGGFEPKDVARQPLDFAIIPSLCSESHSFVLDEAFLLGLPVVVPQRGALAERVGSAGATFEPESASDLAAVLKEILKDPSILEKWSSEIPGLKGMSWHTRELIRIYQKVVGEAKTVELVPDFELPNRRQRNLGDLLSHHEQLMFGYLGHIKRETGRGDHYEGVVQEMIEEQHAFGREINELKDGASEFAKSVVSRDTIVEFLAAEIAEMREALNQVDAEDPKLPLSEVPPPSSEDHVPGLGSMATIRRQNRSIMMAFLDNLRQGRAEPEDQGKIGSLSAQVKRLMNDMGGLKQEIEALNAENRGLDDICRETTAELEKLEVEAAKAGEEAAKAGEEAAKAATKTMEASQEEVAHQQLILNTLAGMVDTFRKVVLKIHDPNPSWRDMGFGLAKNLREIDVPNLGTLGNAMTRNEELISSFSEKVAELHRDASRGQEDGGVLTSKDELIVGLAASVERLRQGLVTVFDDDPGIETAAGVSDGTGEHVPGLGDLGTIFKTNEDLIQRAVHEVRMMKGLEEPAPGEDVPGEDVPGEDVPGDAQEEAPEQDDSQPSG